MKIKLSVIAVLTLSSQLALADDPAQEPAAAQDTVNTATVQPVEEQASSSQVKSLQRDLTPSLQSKLDDQMVFEFVPQVHDRDEVASIH